MERTFDDEQCAGDDAGYDAGGDALVDAVVFFAEVEDCQVSAAVQRLARRRKRSIRLTTFNQSTTLSLSRDH